MTDYSLHLTVYRNVYDVVGEREKKKGRKNCHFLLLKVVIDLGAKSSSHQTTTKTHIHIDLLSLRRSMSIRL